MPHALFDSRLVRLGLALPPYVVLVRDLRAALVSNYEKWKERYGVSFKEYLRGDPRGRRYIFDLWGGLHFLNRWARVRRRFPAATLEVRYEDLQASPEMLLGQIFKHFASPSPRPHRRRRGRRQQAEHGGQTRPQQSGAQHHSRRHAPTEQLVRRRGPCLF